MVFDITKISHSNEIELSIERNVQQVQQDVWMFKIRSNCPPED